MLRISLLLVLTTLFNPLQAALPVHTIDCDRFPEVCDLKCYAIFRANYPSTLTYSQIKKGPNRPRDLSEDRRRAAKTDSSSKACGCPAKNRAPKVSTPPQCVATDSTRLGQVVPCSSPDEYPYATSEEGGFVNGRGAIFRCIGVKQNTDEGSVYGGVMARGVPDGCGGDGQARCQFEVAFSDNRPNSVCNTKTGDNDHNWYWDGTDFILHDPNPSSSDGTASAKKRSVDDEYHPLHMRREFLLENGRRVIVGNRNQTYSYDEAIFEFNGEELRIVKELLGREKTRSLRHPDLTREVPFTA